MSQNLLKAHRKLDSSRAVALVPFILGLRCPQQGTKAVGCGGARLYTCNHGTW